MLFNGMIELRVEFSNDDIHHNYFKRLANGAVYIEDDTLAS